VNYSRSTAGSAYMEWAKLCSNAPYNLATSGMTAFPLAELDVKIGQLEINGPGGYGYKPLLEKIATRYDVSQESIVSAIGTSMGNYLTLAATTEPGDEILVERPYYEPVLSTARYLGLTIEYFQRQNNFAIDLGDLERRTTPRTRVIVITNLHNPTGAFSSESTLREVAAIARKNGAYVLVDEVYREMLFEVRPRSAFHIDPERFLITNSLTKAYGLSGLRCGWVLAPPDVARRMWRINDLHGATFVHPGELLSVIAFEQLGQISAHMKALLETNRNLLRQFLGERDDLDCYWPEYGTIVFPRLRCGNAEEFCELLRTRFETTVVPGRFFECPDRFRMGVGGPTETIRESLYQLGKGLDVFADATISSSSRRSS
jgi:aspartate/methionine/tyrosine aminotransferase